MMRFVGSLVERLLKPALPALGTLLKGHATGAGIVGVVATQVVAAVAPHIPLLNAANVVDVINALTPWVTALFTCVGSFGLGRKAVVAALAAPPVRPDA